MLPCSTTKKCLTMSSSTASDNAETPEDQPSDPHDDPQQSDRRGSFWSSFWKTTKEESSSKDSTEKDESQDGKMPAKSDVVVDNVVEKNLNEEPKLMDEPDESVPDGDKKPAAKPKSDKEEIVVPPVTMQEATYSKERMIEALKMLGPFLEPEPATTETGHLDSVLERNFSLKNEESYHQIFEMMKSQDLSPEFKLLTVAAFQTSSVQNRALTKQLLLNSESTTIGAKIMEVWMYEATKNLEHLATTVETDEKRWFHALTASFLVMECLKVLWHCLVTEKKEQLIDKKNQLNKLNEEYALDWNQPDYLNDIKTCGRTIGADAFVRVCDTIKSRLILIMSSREAIKIENSARNRCSGITRNATPRRNTFAPRPIIRRDDRTPEEIAQAQRLRAARMEQDRVARLERIRRLEALRATRAAEAQASDEAAEGDGANANGRNDERPFLRRDRRLREAYAEFERNEFMFRMAEERRARLRRNEQDAAANQRRDENVTRVLETLGGSNHEAPSQVPNGGVEAPRVVERDDTQPAQGATNNVEGSDARRTNMGGLVRLEGLQALATRNAGEDDVTRGFQEAARRLQNENNEGTNNAARLDETIAGAGSVRTFTAQDFLAIFGTEIPAIANEENVSNGDETPGGVLQQQEGSQPVEEATGNLDGVESRRNNVQGPVVVANSEAQLEDAASAAAAPADEGSEQNNNGRGSNNNNERTDPAVNGVAADGREEDDFSAAVARAAFPHIDGDRRGLFVRTLRNDEGRAAATARRLEIEEDVLLWGPRLPARRRLMMARRAIRDGQADALDVEQELLDLDMLAYMEELEMYDPFGLDRRARPARPEPPRRPPARPMAPMVPRHLIELRELEEAAKTKPFSRVDGLELVKPSFDFDMQQCFIRRVTACVGWAIHGLIFEFADGKRQGTLMVNPGDRPMKLHDKNLSDRACVGWTDIEYGDYIVGMHGDTLRDNVQSWFCYSLVLTFASGKTVHYEANHEPWRGSPFSFDVPTTTACFITRISFKHDQNEDMLGMVTSIHLPMSQQTFKHLPLEQKKAVGDVLEIGKHVDIKLENSGRKPMGEDVWWLILSYVRGWELLPPSPNAKGTKDGQRLFDLFANRFEYSLPSY